MGTRTIIRDGVVVNVIAIHEGTAVVTKGQHREAVAAEDAAYQASLAAWRNKVAGMREVFQQTMRKAGIAAVLAEHALPAKPRLVRAARYVYPDGCEVGPAGGNIGDLWDGRSYRKPKKVIARP